LLEIVFPVEGQAFEGEAPSAIPDGSGIQQVDLLVVLGDDEFVIVDVVVIKQGIFVISVDLGIILFVSDEPFDDHGGADIGIGAEDQDHGFVFGRFSLLPNRHYVLT